MGEQRTLVVFASFYLNDFVLVYNTLKFCCQRTCLKYTFEALFIVMYLKVFSRQRSLYLEHCQEKLSKENLLTHYFLKSLTIFALENISDIHHRGKIKMAKNPLHV